jgi:hypothetical protein
VANRRAGGGLMMGAAAFNDPSLARDARRVCICGVRALVGAFFYANEAGWCHRGAPGRAGQPGRASHIHTGGRLQA